ncbi:MAG: ATP-binding cassette domain-containing protein [Cytophagales bacterium]|nr:ATP-binding cassette domain-containing protein [Cytophagales bacterium]
MKDKNILEVNKLSKRYGSIRALTDFDMRLQSGQIVGLLGPNGSGKTTALSILLGVNPANSGSYSWFGKSGDVASVRRRIGAVLEAPAFYPYMSGEENLKIVADIKQADYSEIGALLETVELSEWRKYKFSQYSLGMKQRLAIAAALLGNPEVLILDEPTNGLDPKGIAEIREIILKIGKQGKTILLASHLLDEVQKICTHVHILRKGTTLYSGAVSEMLQGDKCFELKATDPQKLQEALEKIDWVKSVRKEGELFVATIAHESYVDEFSTKLSQSGLVLTHFAERKGNLEKEFLKLLNQSES